MRRWAAVFALAALTAASRASWAGPETGSAVDEAVLEYEARTRLPETVVTPTLTARPLFDTPRAVTTIDRATIEQQAPVHIVESLTQRDAGIIMDQRTSGTGDPVMRGFAGFNLLTLIDGNSLSTLWGEGGFGADDMYGKIDTDTVERIEVVRGPHSFLYGSNALGGVINVITRGCPLPYTEAGVAGGGRTRITYYSNNDGLRERLEGFLASPEFRVLVGVSHAHLGDYEAGRGGDRLTPSSGNEMNFDARGDWRFAPGHELTLSILNVDREDQYRYYRPTQENEALRTGVALSWRAEQIADGIENFEWRLYYQRKKDTRYFKNTDKEGYALTETGSMDLRASSPLGSGHYLTYGAHASRDDGRAPDDEQFYYRKPRPSVSDSPDSRWANYGVFLQDEWDAVPEWFALTFAARYDYLVFHSLSTSAYAPPAGDPAEDFYHDSTDSLTGGIGATFIPEERWRILGSWSRGFRQYAPNFGIRQLGAGTLIPNDFLDPVTSDNYEVGFRANYPAFSAESFFYYSDIDDWQEVGDATFNGSDWYDFNGNGTQDANENVVAYQAIGSAYIYGLEGRATLHLHSLCADIPPGYSVWGGYAWNTGKDRNHNYMRHCQPLRGLVGVRWDDSDPDREAFVELIVEMVNRFDRIPADRLASDLAWRRDPQDGSSPLLRSYGGVPGYTLVSLYGGINLCDNARVRVGIENLTDQGYRRAHSRMDGPGINFVTSLDVNF